MCVCVCVCVSVRERERERERESFHTVLSNVHDSIFFSTLPCYNIKLRIYHHHHHIALVARISLTLSRHSSLSFIALGRSSGQHPVSSHSC